MKYFSPVDEGFVIIKSGGIYCQTTLHKRGGRLYAKKGGGFVRLMGHGDTSHPSTKWLEIDPGPEMSYREKGMDVLVSDFPVAAE